MALASTSATNGRPGASTGLVSGRGRPAMVTMRQTSAIAPLIEAQALCAEVIDGTERIQTAAALGSREQIVNEAGRLGHKATLARDEFRRMAGELEK